MNIVPHQSAPTRVWAEMEFLDRIDGKVRELAATMGAIELQFPVLISSDVLDRAEYPQAFPHLLLSATHDATPSGWCLSPAVCYHVYEHLSRRQLSRPTIVTARGRCFRAERERCRGVRQVEFEMRELVLLGPSEWIQRAADEAPSQLASLAAEFGLEGEWVVAADPFFLPAAAGKALMQQLQKTKVEYQWPRAGGLALASINRHGTFFGTRFGITDRHGDPVHSICVAVGLDRCAHHATGSKPDTCDPTAGCAPGATR